MTKLKTESTHKNLSKLNGTHELSTAIIQVNLLAGTRMNWRILLEQSFTADIPLLTAISVFGLGEDAKVLLNGVIYTPVRHPVS